MTIIYVYKAALYCETCGERIRAELTAQGKAPADPDDQASYDSDEFPKDSIAGETDSLNFCDSGERCADPIALKSGHKIGCYLKEDLTEEGIKNLQSSLSRADLDPVLRKLYKDVADAHNVDYLTEDQIKELRAKCRFIDVRRNFSEPCLNCRKLPQEHDPSQYGYCANSTRQRDAAVHYADKQIKAHKQLTKDLDIAIDAPAVAEMRLDDGTLPQYTSIGCYTIGYYTKNGDMLCAECASDPDNGAEYVEPFYEGASEFCAECNKEIESAYGDPEEPSRECHFTAKCSACKPWCNHDKPEE